MPSSINTASKAISSASVPSLDAGTLSGFDISRRALKISLAVALCSAGAFGMLSESTYISTSNAVVSTQLITIRTPIDGTLRGLPVTAGGAVTAGQLLGSVDNARSDPQHLDDLRILESNALSTVGALTAERTSLQVQQHELLARSKLHGTAVSSRLQQQAVTEGRTLSGLKVALGLANTELRRGQQLHDAGILADADLDRLRSSQLIAAEAVGAEQANIANLQAQASDASGGLLSEAGDASDVSYSRQRADEIAIKLAENSSALAIALGQAKEAHSNVQAASAREALMSQSELRSPIEGYLWKLDTTNGEHTLGGASILSLVDCRQQIVLAQVPQNRVPDIAIHREARIRLAGESEERTGTVLSVEGDVLKLPDTQLAALPFQEASQQMATVWIRLNTSITPNGVGSSMRMAPSESSACVVGRTARVLIPTFSTNLASRWIHDIF